MVGLKKTGKQKKEEEERAQELYPDVSNKSQIFERQQGEGSGARASEREELAIARGKKQGLTAEESYNAINVGDVLKEQIKSDPSAFGLSALGETAQPVSNIEVSTIPAETQQGVMSNVLIDEQGKVIPGTEETREQKLGREAQEASVIAGAGLLAPASVAGTLYKVGEEGVALSATRAVQAGNSIRNSAIIQSITKNPLKWGVAAYATTKGFEGFLSYIGGEKTIEAQQQSLNTIGQMATTIGGQATEGAGDWKQGLKELDYLYDQVNQLSQLIQQSKIASATIKFNGKIYDITADMEDQLRTIDEQRTIIRSFVLTNSFPELNELELQSYLRQLEAEGVIQSYDITKERKYPSQQEAFQGIF